MGRKCRHAPKKVGMEGKEGPEKNGADHQIARKSFVANATSDARSKKDDCAITRHPRDHPDTDEIAGVGHKSEDFAADFGVRIERNAGN